MKTESFAAVFISSSELQSNSAWLYSGAQEKYTFQCVIPISLHLPGVKTDHFNWSYIHTYKSHEMPPKWRGNLPETPENTKNIKIVQYALLNLK